MLAVSHPLTHRGSPEMGSPQLRLLDVEELVPSLQAYREVYPPALFVNRPPAHLPDSPFVHSGLQDVIEGADEQHHEQE